MPAYPIPPGGGAGGGGRWRPRGGAMPLPTVKPGQPDVRPPMMQPPMPRPRVGGGPAPTQLPPGMTLPTGPPAGGGIVGPGAPGGPGSAEAWTPPGAPTAQPMPNQPPGDPNAMAWLQQNMPEWAKRQGLSPQQMMNFVQNNPGSQLAHMFGQRPGVQPMPAPAPGAPVPPAPPVAGFPAPVGPVRPSTQGRAAEFTDFGDGNGMQRNPFYRPPRAPMPGGPGTGIVPPMPPAPPAPAPGAVTGMPAPVPYTPPYGGG